MTEEFGPFVVRIARASLQRAPQVAEKFREAFSKARAAYREELEAANAQLEAEIATSHDPALASYYANLEVPYGSDLRAVAKAWKAQVKKYHPDLHADDPRRQELANQVVQGLNRAYEELERRLGTPQ